MSEIVDDPVAPPPAPAPAPVETPPPALVAAAPEGDDELQPADLVDAEKATGLIAALKATRSEARALKERASQADNLAAQVQQMQAYIQGLQQQQQRPPEPVQQQTQADPELVELARSLDYYTANGQPDVERAGKHAAIIQRQAARIAQQMVGPLQQQTAQERSAGNYQRAVATKTPDGRTAKQETLNWMWRNLPPEMTSDPRVAQVLPMLALGMDMYTGGGLPPAPAPPAGPPLVTEASGGRSSRSAPISDAERKVLEARGMDEKKYADYTKDWKPGRGTVLED